MSSEYHASYYIQRTGMSAALLADITKPFHRKLLDQAQAALRAETNEFSVVLAQAAAEMCTEWALTVMFTNRDLAVLAEPVLDLFQSTNICNEKLHSVFAAISGDRPNQQPFWKDLKLHTDLRNDIVHRGARASPVQATASLEAVTKFVEYTEELQKQTPKRDASA
jgi:hypothetical protein